MILGHSDPDVTRKVYAHLMRKAAAEQVEAATELLTRHRQVRRATHGGDEEDGEDGAAAAAAGT